MLLPRRKLLLGGAGLSALGLSQADAATPFTTFAFSATGAPGARNMPDRLADVHNVKDFGAAGDGSTNDTTAIQNAVNWTASANRGTIFFPNGTYIIESPITFTAANISIRFLGEGQSTVLSGQSFGSGGYILDRSLGSPSNTGQVIIEKLSFQTDSSVSGCIRIGSCLSAAVRDCFMAGPIGITTEDSPGNSSQNILIQNVRFPGGENGLIMGGPGCVQNCDVKNVNVGFRMYGKGWTMFGNRAENCNTGYLIGVDNATAATLTSATISAGVLTFSTGTPAIGQQLAGANIPDGISILSGSGTTWNISGPAVTISTPQTITTIGNDQGASGFAIVGGSLEGDWVGIDLAGTCSGFYIGSLQNQGHGSSNSGVNPPSAQGSRYGVFCRAGKASNGVFSGLTYSGPADIAAMEIDSATSRANLVAIGCNMVQTGGAGGAQNWINPGNAYTAQFQNCNNSPVWRYSNLPQSTNVLEGDEFSISDSTTNTWGANVTVGSGGDHVLVRYNGSNYTVVAK